ncbi:MAG: ABC transporter permease [Lachnospiraceae bacterium]|nr:ABC transporter permease [Lachnospiraceae bacterium]
MNYIRLYIKRTFSRNLKKQAFLIFGIAAFMAMLAGRVMSKDSEERRRVRWVEETDWGFDIKISDVSAEAIDYLNGHKETVQVEPIRKVEVTGGIDNVKYLISSAVPDTWKFTYLYGKSPEQGEILLTENALIGKRQPVSGETVWIEVKTGEETKQIKAVVSGVVEALGDFTQAYAFLYAEDFKQLTDEVPYENGRYDAFVQTVYGQDGNLTIDFHERFGTSLIVGMRRTGEVYGGYSLGSILYQIILVTILFGACLGAIIYIVLQDEKQNIGILRALGAKKIQITVMLTVRILVSGIIGIILGSGVTLLMRKIEKVLTYTDAGIGDNTGMVSLVMIPLGGIAMLLLLQLPAIFALLKETPVTLMNEMRRVGGNLISLKSKKELRIKHPIWWYAGLEGKRLRGRRIGLAVITVFGLFFPTTELLMVQYRLQSNVKNAFEETYTVNKENGSFTEEEVIRVLGISGIQSAGFSVEQSGDGIAEYEGKPVTVRLQILDERSFRQMKMNSEKVGIAVSAESGQELLGETGILVRNTLKTTGEKIAEGEMIRLLSPSGEHYDCEVVMVAQNMGEVDADYYMFISFSRYCEIFGLPELYGFSVTLHDIKYTQAADMLARETQELSITKNALLYGNTLNELNNDTLVSTVVFVVIAFLTAIVFLFCYYSFYYLAKTEEYRKLFAMGASKSMVRKMMLFQSLRSSWILALVNAGIAYFVYRLNINTISDQWLKKTTVQFPLTVLFVLVLIVIGICISATWFASGQVLKELEQKK